MESGVKCMIAGFIMLGRKGIEIFQVSASWKMSEAPKLVLRPLACRCNSKDTTSSKILK